MFYFSNKNFIKKGINNKIDRFKFDSVVCFFQFFQIISDRKLLYPYYINHIMSITQQ